MSSPDRPPHRIAIVLATLGMFALAATAITGRPDARLLLLPLICSAALWIRLPTGRFIALCSVIAAITFLTPTAWWHEPSALPATSIWATQRSMALACVLVLVLCKSGPAIWTTIRSASSFDRSLVAPFDLSDHDQGAQTVVHRTKHGDQPHATHDSDWIDDFSVTPDVARDVVNESLGRLAKAASFDARELRLIEAELRLVHGGNDGIHHALGLDAGVQVGPWTIDETLGRGGEGSVYRGHDPSGRSAAIKVLHNVKASERFRREMDLVRKLGHVNIVTAYDVGDFHGLPYMAMELLSGPDLHLYVREAGALDWRRATQICLQAVRACAHAHRRGLIHRDIKPGNLIFNGEDAIKVVDFGLASIHSHDATIDSVFHVETKDGHLAGTLPFMAPEQARSLANANEASDIYSLGATWFYLLTGEERLRGSTFADQFENLLVRRRFNALPRDLMPRPLQQIFRRMTAYHPSDRYVCCDQLAFDLERALAQTGEATSPDQISVLVIDDSRVDLMYTIEMLRRYNPTLQIHQAQSLADGLEVCRMESIDLVLLDLTLPDSSGMETVRRFRRFVPSLPLVIITGVTSDGIGADCIEAGADSFLTKDGLSPQRMERAIFVTLSRHDATTPDVSSNLQQLKKPRPSNPGETSSMPDAAT